MTIYTEEEDAILAESIMGEWRGLRYRSWREVQAIVDEKRAARGLPPRGTHQVWYNRYTHDLMFRLNHGNFDEDRCMVRKLPWTPQEFERLKDLIPSCIPGGRSMDHKNINQEGRAMRINWRGIAEAMVTTEEEKSRYTEFSVPDAYHVRILPEYNARFAINPGPPAVAPLQPVEPSLAQQMAQIPDMQIPPSLEWLLAPPRERSPAQEAALTGYMEGLGSLMFPNFGFVWGQGWQVIDSTNPRDINNMELNDRVHNIRELSSEDDDDDASPGLHPAESIMNP